MPRLFTDFDGPIMDVSERYYQVYLYCLAKIKHPQQNIITLTKAEFWRLKRSQVSEIEIAQQSGLGYVNQAQDFAHLRRESINAKHFFAYDQIYPQAIIALEAAQAAGLELAVVTMRRQSELFPVLAKFDLSRFFPQDHVFCLQNDYIKTKDIFDKPKLMSYALCQLPPVAHQWMVGDTEADILSGSQLQIPTIAVLSGIRNRVELEKYHPQAIAQDLQEAVAIILKFLGTIRRTNS